MSSMNWLFRLVGLVKLYNIVPPLPKDESLIIKELDLSIVPITVPISASNMCLMLEALSWAQNKCAYDFCRIASFISTSHR